MGGRTQDTTQKLCFARAISAELGRLYPHHTAKYVAQDLGCTPKAAANLLDGHLSAASVAKLITAYGPGWVAERVLEAGGLTLTDYIRRQAQEARATASNLEKKAQELAHLETELRAARRPVSAGHVGRGP